MNKRVSLSIVARIAEIISSNCETNEEVEQVEEGIKKWVDFFKSIPQL